MGIDATLYIIADYSRHGRNYASVMIEMHRISADFAILNALPKVGHEAQIQVMRGSWVTLSDGTRPPGTENDELGYLSGDSYDPTGGFTVHRVADLAAVSNEFSEYNRKIVEFVAAMYPKHRFIVIWH